VGVPETVPVVTDSIESKSPWAKLKLSVVSLQEVAEAPDIVHVTAWFEPFFRHVHAIEFPLPGAGFICTDNAVTEEAEGAAISTEASVPDGAAPPPMA